MDRPYGFFVAAKDQQLLVPQRGTGDSSNESPRGLVRKLTSTQFPTKRPAGFGRAVHRVALPSALPNVRTNP